MRGGTFSWYVCVDHCFVTDRGLRRTPNAFACFFPRIQRWFYAYYWFFGYLCVGTEFAYMMLYARNHVKDAPQILQNAMSCFLAVCIPACLAKQAVNVAQLMSACQAVANYDAEQINNKTL